MRSYWFRFFIFITITFSHTLFSMHKPKKVLKNLVLKKTVRFKDPIAQCFGDGVKEKVLIELRRRRTPRELIEKGYPEEIVKEIKILVLSISKVVIALMKNKDYTDKSFTKSGISPIAIMAGRSVVYTINNEAEHYAKDFRRASLFKKNFKSNIEGEIFYMVQQIINMNFLNKEDCCCGLTVKIAQDFVFLKNRLLKKQSLKKQSLKKSNVILKSCLKKKGQSLKQRSINKKPIKKKQEMVSIGCSSLGSFFGLFCS